MKYKVPSRRSKPENDRWPVFCTLEDAATILYVVTQVTTITIRSAVVIDSRLIKTTTRASISDKRNMRSNAFTSACHNVNPVQNSLDSGRLRLTGSWQQMMAGRLVTPSSRKLGYFRSMSSGIQPVKWKWMTINHWISSVSYKIYYNWC